MEERKRPASDHHENSEPPLKRHAATVNGTPKAHIDADMPWKDDLERFQKEAIYRQLLESKRERNTLESRLNDMSRKTIHHDEHLMVIDAWFSQLIDEIKLLVGDFDSRTTFSTFPSNLLTANTDFFKKHLMSRSAEISSAIFKLFSTKPESRPEIPELQSRISQLLESEKTHIVELEKSRLEKEKLTDRLEDACMRYMVAEKKLDRMKSATVAKLEKQALAAGQSESASGVSANGQEANNGQPDPKTANGEELFAADLARKEAVAESAKRKEQLDTLEAENEKLMNQVTTLNNRLSHLSDDDYSRTDLFKHAKSQLEDVIKRINHLEATNVQLQEEAVKLQAERTAYCVQLEKESQTEIRKREEQLKQAENDLVRIRNTREELLADVKMRKEAQSQDRTATLQIKELLNSYVERIKAVESENSRLKLQLGDSHPSPPASIDGFSPEELQSKYSNMEKQYSLLNNELQSMGTAFKKTSALASQKVANYTALEEKVARLNAEKSRADQKYFAAARAQEARELEVRTLRAQNNKSSEMVSSLKDSETASRALLVNLEKQLAENKELLHTLENRNRTLQHQLTERNIEIEGLKIQADELKRNAEAKDTMIGVKSTAYRKAETEIETLKVQLDEKQKSLEMWKAKGLGNQSDENEALRMMALCSVCRKNFKNTAIKTCGHVFCKECVEERTASRSRKCPNCSKSFGANDTMRITL